MDEDVRREEWMGRFAPHPPHPPAATASRAGRNLPQAIVTAVALLAVVALSLFVWIDLFVVLVFAFMATALWEASGAFQARSFSLPVVPLWLSAAGICAATWGFGEGGLLVSFYLASLGTAAWRIVQGGRWARRDAAAGMFALAWIGLLGGFAILLAGLPHGAWAVVTFVLLPVANDTGGYAAGVLAGRHPMAPSISPKKSWEGFAGSVLVAVAAGIACSALALDIAWWWGIVLGIACTVAATAGDLGESLLKRDLGVKDMGSIFPGHGGALDRVDSILVCAPVVYFILLVAS